MKARSILGVVPWAVALVACSPSSTSDRHPSTSTSEPVATESRPADTALATAATATTAATAPASASAAADVTVPPDSADYSAALTDAKAYKKGEITFDELQKRVLARKLPPHKLGDSYLFMTPPPPPPGIELDPLLMPADWKGTWGEIAMTLFAGQITKEEYDELHEAAHPACK